MAKQRKTMPWRAVLIALLLTAAWPAAQGQEPLSAKEIATRCWGDGPVTLRLPDAEGACVRVLTMYSASTDLQQVLDLVAGGNVSSPHRVNVRRFAADIEQFPVDISSARYALVEGMLTPSHYGSHVTSVRLTSLTWDQLLALEDIRFKWAPIREKVAKVPAEKREIAARLSTFADQESLRRLLALLLEDPENYWEVRDALEAFNERNPMLTAKYAPQIRAALDVTHMGLEGVETMRRNTDCVLFDDCRAFEAHAHRLFDRADHNLDWPDAEPWVDREWLRFAVAWLARQPVWREREREVYKKYVGHPLESLYQWTRAPLEFPIPAQKPLGWSTALASKRDVLDVAWRAVGQTGGWANVGPLVVGGETEDVPLYREPPGQPQMEAPVGSRVGLSLLNLGSTAVRVRSGDARLRLERGTRTAKLDEALDVEVPPRTWLIWRGSFRSPGTVTETDRGDLELTIRGGYSSATLKLPFKVSTIS